MTNAHGQMWPYFFDHPHGRTVIVSRCADSFITFADIFHISIHIHEEYDPMFKYEEYDPNVGAERLDNF